MKRAASLFCLALAAIAPTASALDVAVNIPAQVDYRDGPSPDISPSPRIRG